MQRKNKLIIQTFPVKSPSPDKRNHNRLTNTTIQANTIKRYLQSIKTINQNESVQSKQYSFQQSTHRYSPNKIQASSQSRTQEILRRRIMELQMQNNQFRLISKEFEDLSNKNRQLQQKMLMLLSELEYSQSQPRTHNKSLSYNYKTSKIDGYSTIQNIRTQQSKQQSIKHTYPTDQFDEQLTNSPFHYLRIQTHKKNHRESPERQLHVKKQIDSQLNTSLENFQSVFIKLVKLLDSQLNQLKNNTQQIQNLPLLLSSSSQGNVETPKLQQQNLLYKINKPNQSFPIDNTKKKHQKVRKQSEESKVVIPIQNIQGSQLSQGYMHRSHRVTQKRQLQLNHIYKKRDNPIHKSIKCQTNQKDQIIKKILYSIDTINTNLAIILSEQNRINQTTTTFQFQNQIFQKLQDIINTYFSHKKMHTSSLICQQNLRQSLLLRQKIKITESGHSGKPNEANHKQQKEVYSQLLNIEEQRTINLHLPPVTHDISCLQFEQTKRKLQQIIEIMKSIKQEYRKTLIQKLNEQRKQQSIGSSNRFF